MLRIMEFTILLPSYLDKYFHRTQRPRVLELLDGWKGEAHIFRSPAQCAAFLAQQKNQNTPGME